MTQEYVDSFQNPVSRFFRAHTKAELLDGAIARKIQVYPLADAADMLASRQLNDRQYWAEVEHPELQATLTYPGTFIKSTEAPVGIRFRAPTIGEHNAEIYSGELGLSGDEVSGLKASGVI